MEQRWSKTSAGGQLTCSTLSLMVPTLRLMSAFAWQVVQHCNLIHYGKVEELVMLVTEVAPDLLSLREKVDILLGLRARPPTSGPVSVAELQTLVWEFISRLDKLLPLPDIKQTAELLGAAPSLLEECGQLEFEPAQLKTLLDHHTPQDNALECSGGQIRDTIPSTASCSQSKPTQDCFVVLRRLSPHRTTQAYDHTYPIEEEDDAMGSESDEGKEGNTSDEEWLPLPENYSPTQEEPDPAPSSHAEVAPRVPRKSKAQSWWTCKFTRKITQKSRTRKNVSSTRQFRDTLTELVRNHPHLYDITRRESPFHADSTWNDIGKALNLSKEECRRRWTVQRDRFGKAHRRAPEKRSSHDLAVIQRLGWLKPYRNQRKAAVTFIPVDDDKAPESSTQATESSTLESIVSPTEAALVTQAEPSSSLAQVSTATIVSKTVFKNQSSTSDLTQNKKFIMAGFEDTLCELVRKHPTLYDPASPLHFKTQHVLTIWNDIGRALQLSGEECRHKWKLIRSRLARANDKHPVRRNGQDLAILQRLAWLKPYMRRPSVWTRILNDNMEPELSNAEPSLLESVVNGTIGPLGPTEGEPEPAALMAQPESSSHSQEATAAAVSTDNCWTSPSTLKGAKRKNLPLTSRHAQDMLCELVRKHPNLYDPEMRQQYTGEMETGLMPIQPTLHRQAETWDEIAKTLQLSGVRVNGLDCRRKWKNLRDGFIRSTRKHPLKRSGLDLVVIKRLAWVKPYIKVLKSTGAQTTPESSSAKPSLLESVVTSWVQSKRAIPSTTTSSQSKPQEIRFNVKKWRRSGSKLLPHRTEEDKDRQSDHSGEEEEGAEGNQSDEEWIPENLNPPGSSTEASEPAALMSQPEPSSDPQVSTGASKPIRRKLEDGSWPGCALVRNYPHLYDGSEPLSMHSKKCWDSWEEIARTLRSSAPQCKGRWRQICKRFCKAHDKVPERLTALDRGIMRNLIWLTPYVTLSSGRKLLLCTMKGKNTRGEPDLEAMMIQGDPATADGEKCLGLELHTCSLCPFSHSQEDCLLKHIRQEHVITRTPGTIADSAPKHDDLLHSHITALKRRPGPFPCDYCGKIYKQKENLFNHMRLHTGERPFACTFCGRAFYAKKTLQEHVRVHTGERRYTCYICGKTSTQNQTHQRHMRMHRGEKKYSCVACGKAFITAGELRLHTRSHTGERPYDCKLCGKSFTISSSLTVHMRTHTGEKPYSCTLCSKAFSCSSKLKRHKFTHAEKKPFECVKCGKGFSQGYNMRLHNRTGKCKL